MEDHINIHVIPLMDIQFHQMHKEDGEKLRLLLVNPDLDSKE
jgi:hypothetical protein